MGLVKKDTGLKTMDEILKYNRRFVQEKKYESYQTGKFPKRKLAVLTCMDTRLTELLPAALGLKNGDAKMIRNAGGVISDPYGSEIKSLLTAIYELGVNQIIVIGHTDCGAEKMDSALMVEKMLMRKIKKEDIKKTGSRGIAPSEWLCGISSAEKAVGDSVLLLRNHPLIPEDVGIFGFVMDTRTGELMKINESDGVDSAIGAAVS